MAQRLSDGTIVPSTLRIGNLPSVGERLAGNGYLRLGTVVNIYYPQDNQNESPDITYDVLVVETTQIQGASLCMYRKCRVLDLFGMSNNYLRYTLQPAKKKDNGLYKFGSQVLVLCLDGSSVNSNAIIVGGMKHPDAPVNSKEDGQFYDFMFNGVNIKIDKDGAYTVEFNTPLNETGTKASPQAAGTKININKDGILTVSDNESQSFQLDRVNKKATWTDGPDTITIDKANKKISVESSGDISEKAAGKLDMKSTKDASLQSDANVNVKAGANMQVDVSASKQEKVGSIWKMEAGGSAIIKAGNAVLMQAGGMAMIKAPMTTISSGGAAFPAAIAGMSQVLTLIPPGIPCMGTILTGSTSVFVGA